ATRRRSVMATETAEPTTGQTATITLTVPVELARKYRDAPAEKRRAWDLMLELRLHNMIDPPKRSLQEVMDEMSRQAAANGLTEEVVNDILREWDEERKAARGSSAPPP